MKAVDKANTPLENLAISLSKKQNVICFLLYIIGTVWFLLLSHNDVSSYTYVDENALLPGLVQPNFGRKGYADADKINKKLKNMELGKQMDAIENILENFDIQTHKQTYQYTSPIPYQLENKLIYESYNGSNLYGIVRAGRTASVESIVLNLPLGEIDYNYAIGVGIALAIQIRGQPYWAKDIILLFSTNKNIGVQAWVESYLSTSMSNYIKYGPLLERAGNMQAAFILNTKYEKLDHLNIELVGIDGQLPNCDMLNVAAKIFRVGGTPVTLNNKFDKYHIDPIQQYLHLLDSSYQMMKRQFSGMSGKSHAVFLQHGVQALTIEGLVKGNSVTYDRVGGVIEGIFRSINNLIESLHHSFSFYILPRTDRYIGISMFMPPLGVIILAPTLKALVIWFQQSDDNSTSKKGNSSGNTDDEAGSTGDGADNTEDGDCTMNDVMRELNIPGVKQEKHTIPWIEVLAMFGVSLTCGMLLYISTSYAATWSLMFGMPVPRANFAIFVTCYILGAGTVVWCALQFDISEKAFELCRCASSVLLALVVAAVALMNFSFGFGFAIVLVPFNVFNERTKSGKRWITGILSALSTPLLILVFYYCVENLELNSHSNLNIIEAMERILVEVNLHSILSGSWIYATFCMAIYPTWLLLFITTISNFKY